VVQVTAIIGCFYFGHQSGHHNNTKQLHTDEHDDTSTIGGGEGVGLPATDNTLYGKNRAENFYKRNGR